MQQIQIHYVFFSRYSAKELPKRLLCRHKKTFKCMALKMCDLKLFFDNFYERPDKKTQDAFILKHCKAKKVMRRRTTTKKYTEQTFQTKFYIYSKAEKKKVQVCQRYFLTVLQITKYRVQSVMKEYFEKGKLLQEKRGGDRVSHKNVHKMEAVIKFINSIPCTEPHYCRGNTKRYYLASELSINKLWKLYDSQATEDLKVKKCYFRNIFNTKYNLGFGTPRTDVCATCLRFSSELKHVKNDEAKNNLLTKQRLHKLRAKAFFKKVKEEKPGLKIFSFDCEKNLNLLKVPDQVAYYLRNIYLYNFTIVEGSSNSKLLPDNVFAYCWTENTFPKAANEIASALYHRLNNSDLTSCHTLRLMADGCAGQNKNTIMLGMLCKWLTEAPQNIKTIELVFPVVGHSYIPPDRVFARIEKEVRLQEVINSPKKYLDIISKFSTVNNLGADDCKVYDWKTASQQVFKLVGNWHFKFKQCKRYILKRSKKQGNVLIQGHLHYQMDDGVSKNVNKKGKISSMIQPNEINPTNIVSAKKKKDALTLLKSHWGDEWEENDELEFFKTLLLNCLEEVDHENEEHDHDEGLCEMQEEVDDMHV